MITPNLVIDAIVNKLTTNKATLALTEAIELSDDASIDFAPPYAIVFEDFTESAETSDSIEIFNVPCDISVLISSSENETVSASTAEAYSLAAKIMLLIAGYYKIKTSSAEAEVDTYEGTKVYLKPLPLQIITKSAKQVILKLNFQYNFNLV